MEVFEEFGDAGRQTWIWDIAQPKDMVYVGLDLNMVQ
jgi:hypothetical protein